MGIVSEVSNRNWSYPMFEIWADQNRWMVYDRCTPLSLTQNTSLLEIDSPMSLYVRWIMKDLLFSSNRNLIYENIFFKTL